MPVRRLDDYLRRAVGRAAQQPVELEAVLRRLAELIVEEASRRSVGGCDGVAEAVARLEERVRAVEARVEELRRLVEETARMVKGFAAAPSPSRQAGGGGGQQRTPRWLATLLRELEEDGFKLASQLPRDVVNSYDRGVGERYGVHTLDVGGDIVFVKREVLVELVKTVSTVSVGDEAAVAAKLGGRLSRLFMLLRKGGYLVYSASRKGWMPVDELKRIVGG